MSDTKQPNDKRPRSRFVGSGYHIVGGDTTIRPRRASIPYTPPRDPPLATDPPAKDAPVTDATGDVPAGP
jgi:hypothetical protein